jgi:hypothetical protein
MTSASARALSGSNRSALAAFAYLMGEMLKG